MNTSEFIPLLLSAIALGFGLILNQVGLLVLSLLFLGWFITAVVRNATSDIIQFITNQVCDHYSKVCEKCHGK